MTQITGAYIDGIKEGRELLNLDCSIDPVREYENCKILVKSHSFAMKDFFKGQRDFWKQQIKKESKS